MPSHPPCWPVLVVWVWLLLARSVVAVVVSAAVADRIKTQKKDTAAINTTRKCIGTTPNTRNWTGIHSDQYFLSRPRSVQSWRYFSRPVWIVSTAADSDATLSGVLVNRLLTA